jgi:hypothetical protein
LRLDRGFFGWAAVAALAALGGGPCGGGEAGGGLGAVFSWITCRI